MTVNTFSYKLTTENELFSFDFSQVLATGETISTAASSLIVISGVDPNPSSMLVSTPLISNPQVAQRIYNGVANNLYRLIMTVTTSAGNTYTGMADLPVYDPTSIF
jgi:hypothetical protein